MPNGKPPFRADHVGSLLRPVPLREARAARAEGRLPAEALAREHADNARRNLRLVLESGDAAGPAALIAGAA